MLKDHRWVFLVLTSVIIFAIIALLLYTRKLKKHPLMLTSLGLILGGGISNMIDRIFFGDVLFGGKVIDFISFELIDFPIFNIADSCVCIGEALLIIYVFFIDSKIKKSDYFTFFAENKKSDTEKDE
jgi:signal peptidase II